MGSASAWIGVQWIKLGVRETLQDALIELEGIEPYVR